jgi:NADH-quinone oxidoreductase subunit M
VLWLLPASVAGRAKQIALGPLARDAALTVRRALQFNDLQQGASSSSSKQHPWIPQFGVSYALGVDGIALSLILMSVILVPICLLAAWRDLPADQPGASGTTSR